MEKKNENGLVDVVLTQDGKVEEKEVFGFDADFVRKVTEAYCEEPIEHLTDKPIFDRPFWDTVHEGCKKLVEEHKDLLKLL